MLGDSPVATEADGPGHWRPRVHLRRRARERGGPVRCNGLGAGHANRVPPRGLPSRSPSPRLARSPTTRRAIAFLSAWCDQTGTSATLEAITRKEALRFHDALPKLPGAPASPVTLNKYLGRLSVYWQWLRHRELVEADVWERIKIPEPTTAHDELERPFTGRGSPQAPHRPRQPCHARPDDDCRPNRGAAGGHRADLRARDCEAGLFTFKPQKKEKSARGVRRSIPRSLTSWPEGPRARVALMTLFPGVLSIPKRSSSQRERSFRASNEFTEYRRSGGVEEVVPGRRRSLVNFHSASGATSITKAEQADQDGAHHRCCGGPQAHGHDLGAVPAATGHCLSRRGAASRR